MQTNNKNYFQTKYIEILKKYNLEATPCRLRSLTTKNQTYYESWSFEQIQFSQLTKQEIKTKINQLQSTQSYLQIQGLELIKTLIKQRNILTINNISTN